MAGSCPALLWSGCCQPCWDACQGLCMQGTKGQVLLCCAQLRFKALPCEPDKQWKISVSAGSCCSVCLGRDLLSASSPLPGCCLQASCSAFHPISQTGLGAMVAEGGLCPPAPSPSPVLLACCSKQLLGGSVAGCEQGSPGWKWCSQPGVAAKCQ